MKKISSIPSKTSMTNRPLKSLSFW